MNEEGKKLALISDIAEALEGEGVSLTPNNVRARLRAAMTRVADEACHALGADLEDEELSRVANSRGFQEAVAALLNND